MSGLGLARGDRLARLAHGSRLPYALSILAFVAVTTSAAASRADSPRLDTPQLFSPGGVLSPGYPAAHPRPTGPPPDFVETRGWFPIFALTLNPALAGVGKISGRLELAPFRAHALFVEISRLDVNLPDGSFSARGTEIDVGYHLFPLEDGLRGLYLGPRYISASGHNDTAVIKVTGWGADVGYQFVFTPIAINIGVGAAYAKAVLDPSFDTQAQLDQLTPDQRASIPTHQEVSHLIPLLTAAIGLAF